MKETLSETEPADEEAEDNQEEDDQQNDEKALASSRRKKANSVWDYFTKLDPESDKIAECNLCTKNYNYATTIGNLKSHLARSHTISLPNREDLQSNKRATIKSRKNAMNKSVVWKNFEKINEYQAKCIACGKKLSYKSTTHNLKKHLIMQHPAALTNASEKLQDNEGPYEDVQYLELGNEEEQHSDSPETVQEGSIGRYFVSEGEGRSRCSLCEASTYVPRQHLAKKHPKVLAALAAEGSSESDEPDEAGSPWHGDDEVDRQFLVWARSQETMRNSDQAKQLPMDPKNTRGDDSNASFKNIAGEDQASPPILTPLYGDEDQKYVFLSQNKLISSSSILQTSSKDEIFAPSGSLSRKNSWFDVPVLNPADQSFADTLASKTDEEKDAKPFARDDQGEVEDKYNHLVKIKVKKIFEGSTQTEETSLQVFKNEFDELIDIDYGYPLSLPPNLEVVASAEPNLTEFIEPIMLQKYPESLLVEYNDPPQRKVGRLKKIRQEKPKPPEALLTYGELKSKIGSGRVRKKLRSLTSKSDTVQSNVETMSPCVTALNRPWRFSFSTEDESQSPELIPTANFSVEPNLTVFIEPNMLPMFPASLECIPPSEDGLQSPERKRTAQYLTEPNLTVLKKPNTLPQSLESLLTERNDPSKRKVGRRKKIRKEIHKPSKTLLPFTFTDYWELKSKIEGGLIPMAPFSVEPKSQSYISKQMEEIDLRAINNDLDELIDVHNDNTKSSAPNQLAKDPNTLPQSAESFLAELKSRPRKKRGRPKTSPLTRREQVNLNAKRYREKNREKMNLMGKRYREKNREKLSLTRKRYREKKSSLAQFYKDNPFEGVLL